MTFAGKSSRCHGKTSFFNSANDNISNSDCMKMNLKRVNPLAGWSHPLVLILFTADTISGFCSPGGSTRAVPSSEGLTSNSTSEAGSQWSWVTMKDSDLEKKKSRETGKHRRILLVTGACCAPPSVALWGWWLWGEKRKKQFSWNHGDTVRLQPNSLSDVLTSSVKMKNNLY